MIDLIGKYRPGSCCISTHFSTIILQSMLVAQSMLTMSLLESHLEQIMLSSNAIAELP